MGDTLFNFILFCFLLFIAVTLFYGRTFIQVPGVVSATASLQNVPPKNPTSCYSCPSVSQSWPVRTRASHHYRDVMAYDFRGQVIKGITASSLCYRNCHLRESPSSYYEDSQATLQTGPFGEEIGVVPTFSANFPFCEWPTLEAECPNPSSLQMTQPHRLLQDNTPESPQIRTTFPCLFQFLTHRNCDRSEVFIIPLGHQVWG